MKNVSALLMLTALLLTGIMGCNGNGTTPAPLSSEKAITAFTLNGALVTIDETGKALQVKMPFGTDVTSLTPAITHSGAGISPVSGVARNFSSPVTYTVTAADGSTATYTVTVSVPSRGLLKTGQTASFASGDDGDLQKGVAQPSPRFLDNGNTITDNATGLMWTKDGNAPGPGCSPASVKTWQEALNYVACLNTSAYLGHTDWRLPNVKELKSLIHYGEASIYTWLNDADQGFSNVQGNWYWTSTTCWAYDPIDTYAWMVSMSDGQISNAPKTTSYNVWAVREGQYGTISLPKTGQTLTFASGDDGELQKGIDWPSPRFTVDVDTVTDALTGLMWTKDGNAPAPSGCTTGVTMNTADALSYVACLNSKTYLGYSDWRLPNVTELESLVHRGVKDPSAWLNTQGFSSVQQAWYRSSTTTAGATDYAWVVMMGNGNVYSSGPKTGADRVWPVRDSQP